MNVKEMNKRLSEMTAEQIERVSRLVREGYGSTGIKFETGLSVRLINAVFVKEQMGQHDKPHAA